MSRTELVRRTTQDDFPKKSDQLQMRLPPHPARVSPMPKFMEVLVRHAPEHADSLPPRIEVAHPLLVEP